MKHPVTIGVIMLARNTFDFEAARGLYADIKKNLAAIPDATFVCADDLVFEVPDLDEPIDKINKANVDGIAIISGTFHLGHLALEIAKRTNAPLLLWGLPELPYNGGKIRLNSVCGVNLNASNLYKAGRDDFHYCISNDIDMDWVDAVRIRAKLKNAKIGILGFRAHGFFNLAFDELTLYKEIGVLIDHYELTDIWNQPVDDAAVEAQAKSRLPDCSTSPASAASRSSGWPSSASVSRPSWTARASRASPCAAGRNSPPVTVSPPVRRCLSCRAKAMSSAAKATCRAWSPSSCIPLWGWSSPSWPTSPR